VEQMPIFEYLLKETHNQEDEQKAAVGLEKIQQLWPQLFLFNQ